MNETLEYLQTFARFPFALRRFLQHPLTLDEARRIVRERMEHREEHFLQIAERCIYGYARSPYLPLLKMAGCELSDLRQVVKKKGLEGALHDLRQAGVYISFEEFKGRKPVVRQGQTLSIKPTDFDNPFTTNTLISESGGSTGTGTQVAHNLDQLAARAPYQMITASAQGMLGAPSVIWRGILPDSTLNMFLQRAYFHQVPERWFSHIGLRDSKHWIKYGLATYYVILWMKLYGVSIPFPIFVKPDQAIVVARSVEELLKRHQRCRLSGVNSRILRVCLAAEEAGISFQGVAIGAGGEPASAAKVGAIERSGARYYANYALNEAGTLGNGCANRIDFDDVHLFKDGFALITHPYQVEGYDITVAAFNLTTLLPSAPKLFLNLQMDDYGIVEERNCGCEFESYGFTTHVRQVRSYRKLTGEGVTLVGSEMLTILEEVLPERFGGTPLDYQLMEQEDEKGFTRLALVIHPRLAIADEQAVIDVVLNALRQSSAMGDAARTVWQSTNTIKIKRMAPILTARGKLLPLHLDRQMRK